MSYVIRTISLLFLVSLCVLFFTGLAGAKHTTVTRPSVSQPDGKIYVCPDCGLPCDKKEFDHPGNCPDCGMTLVEKGAAKAVDNENKTATVAILLFTGVQIIDYSGPWEVFGEAGFKVHTVAESTEPITTVFGQKVTPEYTFENSPKADILLIPGGAINRPVDNSKVIKWVQDKAKEATYVMSVCNGAFIAAKAGLLDGLTATTVRGGIDKLAEFCPKAKVVYDQRWVDNGKVITTAGLSSGIDGALHMVEKVLGRGNAELTALGMEYRWDPESKYARAALADRYMPNFNGFKGKAISAIGDVDHWEFKALVWEPASAAEIVEMTGKQVVTGTPHARGAVTLLPRGGSESATRSEVQWKFADDKGRGWSGRGVAEPAPGEPGKFLVTVKLARDNSR